MLSISWMLYRGGSGGGQKLVGGEPNLVEKRGEIKRLPGVPAAADESGDPIGEIVRMLSPLPRCSSCCAAAKLPPMPMPAVTPTPAAAAAAAAAERRSRSAAVEGERSGFLLNSERVLLVALAIFSMSSRMTASADGDKWRGVQVDE